MNYAHTLEEFGFVKRGLSGLMRDGNGIPLLLQEKYERLDGSVVEYRATGKIEYWTLRRGGQILLASQELKHIVAVIPDLGRPSPLM